MDADDLMRKLSMLQKIRTKSDELSSLCYLLKDELTTQDTEESNLKEYKHELEQLLAEKLYHVEQLRLIHSDIDMVENLMRQSQQEVSVSEGRCKKLYGKEYGPLLKEINTLRANLNLDPIRQDSALDCEKLQQISSSAVSARSRKRPSPTTVTAQSTGRTRRRATPSPASDQQAMTEQTRIHSGTRPPMKQCVSCLQHIHRNAPICPLCKAKSKARTSKRK